MSDIFQEVDEDLREEKYKSIWNKYKYYIIGLLVLIILGIGLNAFWKEHNLNEINDRSERFFEAIEVAQDDKMRAISLLQEFSIEESSSTAKKRIWAMKKTKNYRSISKEVFLKHGSRLKTITNSKKYKDKQFKKTKKIIFNEDSNLDLFKQ